jgi:hypothetical protein
LTELAAQGVKAPKAVACQLPRDRKVTKIPEAVYALIQANFANLKPVSISSQCALAVDLKSESVTPHICHYSDGWEYALTGSVPNTATAAIELMIQQRGGLSSAKVPLRRSDE